jgi:site-specific DNA recombinase
VEAKLVVPDLTDAASDPDPSLVKLLARAHEWFSRILRGEVKDFQEIATAEKLNRSYVTRAVSLAFLPPATAKAILEGRQPTELTAKRTLRCAHNLPLAWADESLFGTDE